MSHDLSNELQLMLRLMICDRDTALTVVSDALSSNDALGLQDDLPEVAAFPAERDVDVEVVPVGPGLGLRMSQMPALVIAEDDDVADDDARAQASWLIQALERREHAIRRVTEVILATSADFFLGRSDAPHRVPLAELAERAGMQRPSAERVIKNKRLSSPQGRHDLAEFVDQA